MNILEQLLGSPRQQQEYQDFTRRYDQGAPWHGISDQQAYQRSAGGAPAPRSATERQTMRGSR